MVTGVYQILNLVNKKRYIGSASVSIKKRWYQHLYALKRGTHYNPHLQRAWDKYGESNFAFSVLIHCKPDLCVKFEQVWVNWFKTVDQNYGYNLYPIVTGPRGIKRPSHVGAAVALANSKRVISEETRAKLRARPRKPRKEKVYKGHWSKSTQAEEIKKRITRAGSRHTEEAKRRMREAHKRRHSENQRCCPAIT